MEAGVLATAGALAGAALVYAGLWIAQPIVQTMYGIYLPIHWPTSWELTLLALAAAAGCLSGIIPAILAYRRSLADGMAIRV